MGWKPSTTHNFLNPIRNWSIQILYWLQGNSIPFFNQDSFILLKVVARPFINSLLNLCPQIFNQIKIWRVGWPYKSAHFLLFNKVHSCRMCVDSCPILLKIEFFPTSCLEYLPNSREHFLLQHMCILQNINPRFVPPKWLLFLSLCTWYKIQGCLSKICYCSISMNLLLVFCHIPYWLDTPFSPSFLPSRATAVCKNKLFTITKDYFSPIPIIISLAIPYPLNLLFLLYKWFLNNSSIL